MTNNETVTIRNKRTGEVKTVPKHQFVDEPSQDLKGLEGIGEDISSSLESAPDAFVNMIKSIPGGVKNVAKYATSNNPLYTLANVGTGLTESAAALLSSPQILERYLAKKFPKAGEWMQKNAAEPGQDYRSPTFYEKLKEFEKNIGYEPQSEEEASVRNLGGLLGIGKGLTKIPSTAGRATAMTAASAGQGGDPIHAAILGVTGDLIGKTALKKVPHPENETYYRGSNNNEYGIIQNPYFGKGYWISPDMAYASKFGNKIDTVKGKFDLYDVNKASDPELNELYQKLYNTRDLTAEQQQALGLDKNGIERIKLVEALRDLANKKGYEGFKQDKEVMLFDKPENLNGKEVNRILNTAKNIPKNLSETVKNLPEKAGTAASTGIDAVAGLSKAAQIPAVPSLLETLSDYIKYKSIPPEKLAQKKLFSDIEAKDLPQINERMEAAKRLGLSYLTPAEGTLSPFEAAKQGTIGRTSVGSKLLFEKGKERSTSEGQAINNLLDTVYDAKTLDPAKQAAYEETMTASVPDDFIQRQTQRPVVEKAIKTLEGDPAYRQRIEEELGVKLGEVKPNSFMYWDMVKRVLGDMGENAKEQGRATTKSDIISETRRSMVDEMDKIKPEYEVARGIAERKFTRRKLEDVFDKKTMTGNNFYKFLQSKKNFNDVMNKLKAFPEAQQKLKDMHLLFGDLIPNDMSIRSAAALKRTGMSEPRNKLDALKQSLDEKYGKEHDVATIKLMTDPDWLNMLTEYIKNQKGSK